MRKDLSLGRWLLVGLFNLALVFSASADVSITNTPVAGVVYYSVTRSQPSTRLFVAEVNLAEPTLRLRVAPGGPDPDGPGQWQTTLMRPTKIAARENMAFVVNGDFFRARGIKDAEGTNAMFRSEVWSAVSGPAVTDGKVWSTSLDRKPCLVVRKNGKVSIEKRDRSAPDDWEVVAGNTMLVREGVVIPHENKARHPRTAVGLDATGQKLILLVVDGRKPGVAAGMSYDELAAEMARLGCHEALNLDGGGSSVMAVRDAATGEFQILNTPTDGRERAVANALGISVERPAPGPVPVK